jgi:hypothetical protein
MKVILTIAVAMLSLASCAQNNHQNMKDTLNTDEAQVLTVVRQLAQLMIKKDTAAMNGILDENYTLTHMTGYVQPKAEWFDEVTKESMKYYSENEVHHSVTVNGNKATATMQNLVDARIWGSRNTWRLQQKMTLEKRSGKWIILKSVASTF